MVLPALDAAFEAFVLVEEALGAVLLTPSLLSAMLWLLGDGEKKFRCEKDVDARRALDFGPEA